MGDLIVAFAVVLAAGLAVFFVGMRVGRLRRQWVLAILAASGVPAGVYLLFFRDHPLLTQLLPHSAAVIYADPLPWLACLPAGVVVAHRDANLWRRIALASLLVAGGFAGPVRSLSTAPPETMDLWDRGMCVQSTRSTCGPAALATLLARHGIEMQEGELASLCLTRRDGTQLLGLYRGLSLATGDTGLSPRARRMSLEAFQSDPTLLPAVVTVGLTPTVDAREPRYAGQWGWDVGVRHTVVILSFRADGTMLVADPGAGYERWRLGTLADLWTGDVLYLEGR